MDEKYIRQVLGDQEKIIMITRQHWFFLFSNIIMELVVIIVMVAAFIALSSFFPIALIGLIVIIIPTISMVRDILSWMNHQYIVTNRRVIQMMGVVNKSITDSSLEKVNDVKMTQTVFGRMFNYGTIEILTASELGINRFAGINDPIKYKTAMLNAKEQLSSDEVVKMADKSEKSGIPQLILDLDELRKNGVITQEEFQRKKNELLLKL